MKETKKHYMAPVVEQMDARVEKGYFLSSGTGEELEEKETLGEESFIFS